MSKNTNALKTGAPGRFGADGKATPEAGKDEGAQAHLDQNVLARYAAVALPRFCGPIGWPPFRRRTALSATRFLPLAQTWHSKIEIRDECRK